MLRWLTVLAGDAGSVSSGVRSSMVFQCLGGAIQGQSAMVFQFQGKSTTLRMNAGRSRACVRYLVPEKLLYAKCVKWGGGIRTSFFIFVQHAARRISARTPTWSSALASSSERLYLALGCKEIVTTKKRRCCVQHASHPRGWRRIQSLAHIRILARDALIVSRLAP